MNKKIKLGILAILNAAVLVACQPTSTDIDTAKTEEVIRKNIEKNKIPVEIIGIEPTEHPTFYRLHIKDQPSLYVSRDGNYVISGGIINIGEQPAEEISLKVMRVKAQKLLEKLVPGELITYKADKEKYSIFVFTDASCPFCQAFQGVTLELNRKGVTVKYAAFPRGPEFKSLMENIWCSEDRKAAYEQALDGKEVESEKCDSPVDEHVAIGQSLGIQGTPTIFTPEGHPLLSTAHPDMITQELNDFYSRFNVKKVEPVKKADSE